MFHFLPPSNIYLFSWMQVHYDLFLQIFKRGAPLSRMIWDDPIKLHALSYEEK